MKTEHILIVTGFVIWLSGCYTQFATLEDRYSDDPQRVAADSTAEGSQDTVVVKEREVCYWHRTFLGDWELRCYETNYSDDWYDYYNRPWWYYQSDYYNYNCSCPYHIVFNPNCEYCRYYCNRYHYGYRYPHQHYPRGGSGGGIGSGGSGSGTSDEPRPRPAVRPVAPGASGSSGSAATRAVIGEEEPGIIEIGGDDSSAQTNNKTPEVKPDVPVSPGSRGDLKPLTVQEKKKAVMKESNRVEDKSLMKEKPSPKKKSVKEKAAEPVAPRQERVNEQENSVQEKPAKKTDKEERTRPRRRRSLRGK